MRHSPKTILTFCLLVVFLTLNSLTFPKVLAHAFHHSHHTATTHAQPLCFWVCAAGQMEENSNPFYLSTLGLVGNVDIAPWHIVPVLSQSFQPARGPPSATPV